MAPPPVPFRTLVGTVLLLAAGLAWAYRWSGMSRLAHIGSILFLVGLLGQTYAPQLFVLLGDPTGTLKTSIEISMLVFFAAGFYLLLAGHPDAEADNQEGE